MEIQGKVIQVLPVETGAGKNGEWKKQNFILETEGQYPKKVSIGLWGDKVDTVQNNSVVNASIDIESREYNGRWYTEVRAWKIDQVGGSPQQSTPSQPAQTSPQEDDNLPF